MKATKYIIALAAMVAALPSCTNTSDIEGSIGQEITIKARNESVPWTRTLVQNGGTTVLWDTYEEIKVFYKSTGSRFVSTNSSASATADFTGTLNVVLGVNDGVGSGDVYLWGLYPYRSDATSDGSSVTTTLPDEQKGCAGTFAKGTNITVSRSDSFVMPFYNVCGGVRFSLTHAGVKIVTFEGNSGETLAGRIKIGWSGSVPQIQSVSDGSTAITLTAPDGGTFQTGKWYYIIALPGSLANGYKLTFSTGTATAVKRSSTPVTISRGQFGSITDADSGLTYTENGGGNEPVGNNIVFADLIAKYACVEKFDTNGDGEISEAEAAAVTSIAGLFKDWNTVTSFEEIRYFTSLTNLGNAFQGLANLQTITIPSFISKINDSEFANCTALKTVRILNTVTSFGTYVFDGCTSLESVDLPFDLTSLPSFTFRNCKSLASFDLPSGASIGSYAFSGCSSLQSVSLPSNLTTIGSYAFSGCSSLQSVSLPSNLTTIGSYAFSGCSSLQSVSLPSSLKTINNNSFQGCASLLQISIPDSVTSLGTNLFDGCTSLTKANVPSGITKVPDYMFNNCKSLYDITISSSVTKIGNYVFSGCYFINPVTYVSKFDLPASVTTIGIGNFNYVYNVLVPSTSAVSIQSGTFSSDCRIYVPDVMVSLYKLRTNWSAFADNILPISEYADAPYIQAIDMGLSVKWAFCNLGATKPEQYGDYYQWAGLQDVTSTSIDLGWSNCPYHTGSDSNTGWTKYVPSGMSSYWSGSGSPDNKRVLDPEDDVAHVKLGGKWRMPTDAEWTELMANCTWTWTTLNGVNGYRVTSKKAGYTSKSIFLPAAGYRYDTYLSGVGSYGDYWSSSLNTNYPSYAYYLYFNSSNVYMYNKYRYYGRSVRPVSE